MRIVNRYLIRRLGGKVVEKGQLREVAEVFDLKNFENWINYLIYREYIVRIFRGLYYVKTFDEVFLRKPLDIYELISMAMEKLSAQWYFGLYTALRLNGLTHEFFTTIFVISDKIRKTKEINILGQKVMFLRIRRDLIDFGIREKGMLRCSDPEKTLLDFVYLAAYSPRTRMRDLYLKTFKEYLSKMNEEKLNYYLKRYPRKVSSMVEDLWNRSS